jgi:hypothetical protein
MLAWTNLLVHGNKDLVDWDPSPTRQPLPPTQSPSPAISWKQIPQRVLIARQPLSTPAPAVWSTTELLTRSEHGIVIDTNTYQVQPICTSWRMRNDLSTHPAGIQASSPVYCLTSGRAATSRARVPRHLYDRHALDSVSTCYGPCSCAR